MRWQGYIAVALLSTAGAAAAGSTARAQEVLFETAADMPALIAPYETAEDRPFRLGMHGNVEHKSRIFWLGLGVAAILSPDALYTAADGVALRTSFGFRLRSVTGGTPKNVAERVAVVQPAVNLEAGSRLSIALGELWSIYARWALRFGADVTRVAPEDLGMDEHGQSRILRGFMASTHLGAGIGWGPFQLGLELDAYEVIDEGTRSVYAQNLEGRAFVGAFAVFRLSRQVYVYFRALPFEGAPFQYTWGLAAALNPDDP